MSDLPDPSAEDPSPASANNASSPADRLGLADFDSDRLRRLKVGGDSWLAYHFVTNYHLSGRGADAARALFNSPVGSGTQGWVAFGVSVVLAVVTALSLTAAMQRTYQAAWGLKSLGVRGRVFGLGGVVAISLDLLLLSLIGTVVKGPGSGIVHLVSRLALATLSWLFISWLLLGRRIRWRSLLPGAAASGVCTVVVYFASGIYMPHVIAINAERYGAVGITFAIMTWLYVIGLVLVVGAVVGAQLGGARLVRRREFADQ